MSRTGREGSNTYEDGTIRHPRAHKYVARAALIDGAAACAAEQAKRVRYPTVPDAGLLPATLFAVETFGQLGTAALEVLYAAK